MQIAKVQIAGQLDNVTLAKILKGALLALSGGIAVGIVAWLQDVDTAKILLLSFVSLAVPSITNGIKEFKAGE